MDRNKRIDIVRGGAILLVVLEHALGRSDDFFSKVILSFHMPLFFILSGYLAHDKATGESLRSLIGRKIKRFLVPQITLVFLSFTYNVVFGRFLFQTTSEINIFFLFYRYWFLLVMAQVVIAWELLIRICNKHLLEAKSIIFLISRTQTENFLRLRYGKMWHLNEDYPYSYKRHGEK